MFSPGKNLVQSARAVNLDNYLLGGGGSFLLHRTGTLQLACFLCELKDEQKPCREWMPLDTFEVKLFCNQSEKHSTFCAVEARTRKSLRSVETVVQSVGLASGCSFFWSSLKALLFSDKT